MYKVIGKIALNCLRLFVVVYKIVIHVSMTSHHGTSSDSLVDS